MPSLPLALVAHLAAVCLYAGFQLTVRLLVYPQMTAVPAEAFPAYEAAHQRLITPLVGVLFGAVGLTTALLLLDDRFPRWATWGAAALFAVVLGATAFGAVPQHAVLSAGFDAEAHARLLAWDAVRVVAALGQVALSVWLVLDRTRP
jgi:uncharacterized membrane protein